MKWDLYPHLGVGAPAEASDLDGECRKKWTEAINKTNAMALFYFFSLTTVDDAPSTHKKVSDASLIKLCFFISIQSVSSIIKSMSFFMES